MTSTPDIPVRTPSALLVNPTPPVKIPFDSLTLRAVASELRGLLVGGQIQDVRQPTPTELLLGIRSQGRNLLLLLSADAQFARVHLTTTRRANPPTPPAFCMIVRKYGEDAWIRDVRQVGFDRILEVEIGPKPGSVAGEDTAERPVTTLIAEIMGKHSNLILTRQDGTILDAIKRITHRVNRVRETLPGLPYLPPPPQADRCDPTEPDAPAFLLREAGNDWPDTPEARQSLLLSLFAGLSPFLAKELALRLPNPPALTRVWRECLLLAGAEASPVLLRDAFSLPVGAYPIALRQWPADRQAPTPSLNFALDEAFGRQVGQAKFAAIAGELRGKLEREAKRLDKLRLTQERALEEADKSEQHKQTGELILANLWRIEPGAEAVIVQDYYDPELPDRTLTLDPRLSPQENADVWFRRYHKAKDSVEIALSQTVLTETRQADIETARTALAHAQTEEEVRALRDDLTGRGLLREGSEAQDKGNHRSGAEGEFQGHKIRRFSTPEGFDILVGESATANDFLTTRVASPNDWWLHVRAATSSHVVIRTKGQPYQVPRSVLDRAALLCAQHSQQKHSSLVSVDYTLKKHVRKPRQSAPGAADYKNELTLDVTPGR